MASKIIVKSELGTFKRQTARTYTHVVVVREKIAYLEDCRQRRLEYLRSSIDYYVKGLAQPRSANGFVVLSEYASQGEDQVVERLGAIKLELLGIEKAGPHTKDSADWCSSNWAGRLDLANKAADKFNRAHYYVAIIDVVTGAVIRSF